MIFKSLVYVGYINQHLTYKLKREILGCRHKEAYILSAERMMRSHTVEPPENPTVHIRRNLNSKRNLRIVMKIVFNTQIF